MKKLLSFFFILALLLSLGVPALAEEAVTLHVSENGASADFSFDSMKPQDERLLVNVNIKNADGVPMPQLRVHDAASDAWYDAIDCDMRLTGNSSGQMVLAGLEYHVYYTPEQLPDKVELKVGGSFQTLWQADGAAETGTPAEPAAGAGLPAVGDIVRFGRYEQDNDPSNGPEEIEWLVLDVKDGQALLISRYALDCQMYHTSYTRVTWESCTLRSWLNDSFINTAFHEGEQAGITAGMEPEDCANDRVFLLSVEEANTYFHSDEERKCAGTEYANKQTNVYRTNNNTVDGKRTCYGWWLRDNDSSIAYAAAVWDDGSIMEEAVNISCFDVRPALWMDPNKVLPEPAERTSGQSSAPIPNITVPAPKIQIPVVPSIPPIPVIPSIPPIPVVPKNPPIPAGLAGTSYAGAAASPKPADASAAEAKSWPSNGEIWQADGLNKQTELTVRVNQPSDLGMHIKIYRDGTELVSMLFVGGTGSATASLPGGSYTIKDGTGKTWYGPDDSFGSAGDYEVMTFDGGSSLVTLDSGYAYTITVNVQSASPDADSVGSRSTSYSSF